MPTNALMYLFPLVLMEIKVDQLIAIVAFLAIIAGGNLAIMFLARHVKGGD